MVMQEGAGLIRSAFAWCPAMRASSKIAGIADHGGTIVHIPVRLEPAPDLPSAVEYRWDPDTDILTANLRSPVRADGMSGSVEVEGTDGSWLILDVAAGCINGVEVAVWPNVQKRTGLAPPKEVEHRRVVVASARASTPASMEVDTDLAAESDREERTIHFRMGPSRQTRTVQIARDILIDIDGRDRLAGVWLLEVPPFPADL
jgi:hypothetical protein